ncbi:SCAN domain-containing protein 3 [Trichonephila clavipes]|nr:SCAN domain-containing protein 3 [Trichonephila clavipes]
MTDDSESFFNAWKTVFGIPEKRLLCTWHVDRSWRRNISRFIMKKEMQVEAYKTVRSVLVETVIMLKETLKIIDEKKEMKEFKRYFEQTYSKASEVWPYCHRKWYGINTNMHIESTHRTIKHVYLHGEKVKQLDKALFSLMKFVRDGVFDQFISLKKARCKKPHTIAEELILRAAIEIVETMFGDNFAKELQSIPLSNDTVSRRIDDIAEDVEQQLFGKLRDKLFSIQLDEATDSNKDAHFIAYVRFWDGMSAVEELLFCKPIKLKATAIALFDILNNFINEANIEWKNCVGICTDGARTMSGRFKSIQALVKQKSPLCIWTHCMIHREALASKEISLGLNIVLMIVVTVVNYIKMRPLKSRIFSGLCKDMGAVHSSLLFYCEARCDKVHFWLNGYVKKQNCRIWSEANPQVYVETPLHPEELTVLCALWAGGIIGPYFFKNDEGHNVTVNGDRYRAMITNFFIPELNNHDVQELWFQQDGAICHTARATIDLLKDTFGYHLISRFGPVNWPPRSCDLTPLDYFLWGYVKSLVYADKPQTLDYLEDNIRRVIADIRPQMLEKVIENWTSRLIGLHPNQPGSHMPKIIFKM